jgi:hypothetical protein
MRPTTFSTWVLATLTVLMLVAGLLLSRAARAGEAEVTWTHPTQYVDGTALPISQIARTEIEYGICNGLNSGFMATPAPVIVSVTAPAAARTITGLAAGTWCFRARTVSTLNTTPSAWTVNANGTLPYKVILPPVPQPPSNLMLANTQVFTVVKQRDAFVMLPVGTAPAGTACDPLQSVNGYHVIPREAVTFTGSVQPEVVVARCG